MKMFTVGVTHLVVVDAEKEVTEDTRNARNFCIFSHLTSTQVTIDPLRLKTVQNVID